jgi:hypothetical protein
MKHNNPNIYYRKSTHFSQDIVGPWLCKKEKIKEERQVTNCVEVTLTEEGSKWLNKKKRRSEVKENLVIGR